MTETGSDAGTGPDEEDAARSADRKGGPGHTLLLAVALAVPVLAFVAALDGQAWTSIVRCQVTDGTRTGSNRLIELGRKGNGVVGWNLDREEISNGAGCTGEESLYVREPWWRD